MRKFLVAIALALASTVGAATVCIETPADGTFPRQYITDPIIKRYGPVSVEGSYISGSGNTGTFIVEKSNSGKSWSAVGTVTNPTSTANLDSGNNVVAQYVRLKQTVAAANGTSARVCLYADGVTE